MSTVTIKSLEMQNFMSHANTRLDFTKYLDPAGARIVLLDGPNGAGKSSIANAICFCLYGKSLNDKLPLADHVYRHAGTKEKMLVRVVLETEDGLIQVERSRTRAGRPSFNVIGLPGDRKKGEALNTGLTEDLVAYLGCDFDQFTKTVVISPRFGSFCDATPAEKQKILRDLLGTDRVARAHALAGEYEKSHRQLLTQHDNEVAAAQEEIDDVEDTIAESEEKARAFLDSFDDKDSEQLEKVGEVAEEWALACDYLEQAEHEFHTLRAEYEDKARAYNERVGGLEEKHQTAMTRLDTILKEKRGVEAKMGVLEEDIADAKSKERPKDCPTCHRPWPAQFEEIDTSREEAALAELGSRAAQLRAREQKVRSHIDKVSDRIDSIPRPQEPNPGPMENAFHKAMQAYTVLKYEVKALGQLRTQLKEYMKDREETLKPLRDRITKLERKRAKAEEAVKAAKAAVFTYNYWKERFSRKELQSYLIDEAVPLINRVAQECSNILSDGSVVVTFDPAHVKTGSKNPEATVLADNADGAHVYAGQSTGQKRRIELCLLFALIELNRARSRMKFNQIFLDEMFDGMDKMAYDRVMTLLRDRYKGATAYIMTHDEYFKSLVDMNIACSFKDGRTEVIHG